METLQKDKKNLLILLSVINIYLLAGGKPTSESLTFPLLKIEIVNIPILYSFVFLFLIYLFYKYKISFKATGMIYKIIEDVIMSEHSILATFKDFKEISDNFFTEVSINKGNNKYRIKLTIIIRDSIPETKFKSYYHFLNLNNQEFDALSLKIKKIYWYKNPDLFNHYIVQTYSLISCGVIIFHVWLSYRN